MANYLMRGWYTIGAEYIYWISAGQPDFTGANSGYPPGDVTDEMVLQVIPTTGVDPGSGGGDWDYPPMDELPYNPPAEDLETTDSPQPPHPGLEYTGFMSEGDGIFVQSMATQTQGYNVGDLTDLMSEFP